VRYLIVCDGGNVRSHALAQSLKWTHNQEAIAIGRLYMSPETMEMLSAWAERIALVQEHMIESIPEAYHDKVVVTDFGEDVWGMMLRPGLTDSADAYAAALVAS
jgi:hypothetical protein